MVTTFAEATSVRPLSSHTYAAFFPDDWCIGTVPHGGYITATFLKALEAHFSTTLAAQNQPHCIALHLDFLRRTQVGPALFTIVDTKLGRQTSVLTVTLTQDNRSEVVGTFTHSNLFTESGVSFSTGYELAPAPPPVNLVALSQNQDEHWVKQPEMPHAEFRKATTKVDLFFPRGGQLRDGVSDEWVRFANGEKWTNASMGYLCDMFPMPIEGFLKAAARNPATGTKSGSLPWRFWYPTVLLNLDVKKNLPEEGVEWLFARVSVKQIKNGRMDLEVVILDEAGEIVALSHHIALAVDSSRNTSSRSTNL